MKQIDSRLNTSWWALRIALGAGPIITGVDKYFNKLADWGMYLSPLATRVVPISTQTFMDMVGVIEIVAGIIIFTRWTKFGSYLVMAWLLGIVVNLLTMGMFLDIAARDLEMAVAAFVLAQLTRLREESGEQSGHVQKFEAA